MSTIASTAPTSWKWTLSTVVPWTFASASPSRSKQEIARARVSAGRDEARSNATMSGRCRPCACLPETFTSTRVPATPPELPRSTLKRYPERGNPLSALRTSFSAPERESSAAVVMSPAIPEKQSK